MQISIPLKEYAKRVTQVEAAKVLGLTQGGVSHIIRTGREVFVEIDKNGHAVGWYELKRRPLASDVPANGARA